MKPSRRVTGKRRFDPVALLLAGTLSPQGTFGLHLHAGSGGTGSPFLLSFHDDRGSKVRAIGSWRQWLRQDRAWHPRNGHDMHGRAVGKLIAELQVQRGFGHRSHSAIGSRVSTCAFGATRSLATGLVLASRRTARDGSTRSAEKAMTRIAIAIPVRQLSISPSVLQITRPGTRTRPPRSRRSVSGRRPGGGRARSTRRPACLWYMARSTERRILAANLSRSAAREACPCAS